MGESGTKTPVYLITAPVGEILADMSLAAVRVIPKLPLLIHENINKHCGSCLIDRLREQKIITSAQRLIAIDSGLPGDECTQAVDACIGRGESFGIMADSGMPCFVDPGMHLVRYLLDRYSDRVELVPVGASSAMDAAIMASGVDCTRFVFMGHYPENLIWFEDLLGAGLPGIAYVRGDAVERFAFAALATFGQDSELHVTVFGDIRSKNGAFQGRYPIDFLSRSAGKIGSDGLNRITNSVFILHHPWFAGERQDSVSRSADGHTKR